MVHAKCTLSLLLMKLLAVTAKDKISVNCRKNVCKFGDPIEVSFRLGNRVAFDGSRRCCNDRIAIYDRTSEDIYHPGFMTYTCGFQRQYPGVRCPNLTSGTVTFDNADPSESFYEVWPLSPGKYKVCHTDYRYEPLQKCLKFEVKMDKEDKKQIRKKAMITPSKTVYDYGEDIVADFDLGVAFPNSMVSINKVNVFRTSNWVYTGCNSQKGDQRWSYYVSDNCLKMQRSGKVMFTPDNTGYHHHPDHLAGGDYEMRIMYYNQYWDWSDTDFFKDPLATFTVNPNPRSSKSPSSKSPSSKSPSSKSPSSKSPSE